MRRKYGERATCRKCHQEIEWHGRAGGWRDRGNNRGCVAKIVRGEIVQPKKGQKHGPIRPQDWLG